MSTLPPGVRATLLRHWFPLGLLAVATLVGIDPWGAPVVVGGWMKTHHAPDAIIFAIFLFSGLRLSLAEVRCGASDLGAVGAALAFVFVVAPAVGALVGRLPLSPGVSIGLALVAVMPTTLTTGVVMTGAAGGNEATALVTTLTANAAAIVTVPVTLGLLLGTGVGLDPSAFDRGGLALKIAGLVVVPLCLGLAARPRLPSAVALKLGVLGRVNLGLVLAMVWVALAGSRVTLVEDPGTLVVAGMLAVGFHGIMLALVGVSLGPLGLRKGRREAVVFMGGQKTLPLSVLLQTSLFPGYGEALVVCVVHHLVHLMMDGVLVERLRKSS